MKLKDWLEEKEMTPGQFGRLVGTSRQAVHHWLNGSWGPNEAFRQKIEQVTLGKVRADRDWSK